MEAAEAVEVMLALPIRIPEKTLEISNISSAGKIGSCINHVLAPSLWDSVTSL
jgi:hypothetical protein